jgi:hypothetical protein
MKLRDALTHACPERAESRRRVRALEQRLHDRFGLNALASADSPWFPDMCLSSECAEWAVEVANAFSQEFCRRMSLPPRGLDREIETRNQAPERPRRRTMPNGQSPYATSPNESRVRDER